MNNRFVGIFLVLALIVGGVFGISYFLKSRKAPLAQKTDVEKQSEATTSEKAPPTPSPSLGSSEIKLLELSKKYVTDIKADHRLNLKLATQLKSFQRMNTHLKKYAQEIERDLKVIEQISQDSFQEDVKLQASLFAGKKPATIAAHLEKFPSSRVGAILAKMKDKEASKVLDIWAQNNEERVNLFYQEVISSYLNNKRFDAHPHLLESFKKKSKVITDGTQ